MTGKQRAFLAAFAQSGIITVAAKTAKVDRKSHLNWLANPEYAKAFESAREEALDLMEWEARKRAMRQTKPSDLMLIFLLKGGRPEKYRDNAAVKITGADGGPVQINLNIVRDDHNRR